MKVVVRKLRVALVLICVLAFSVFGTMGCDVGLNDIIATGQINQLFPDMEEGEDLLSYLSNRLLTENRDMIMELLTDAFKNEMDNGTFDEMVDSLFGEKYDDIVENVFEDNREEILEEVRGMLKETGADGTNEIFSDDEVLKEIRESLIKDETLKNEIAKEILEDPLFQQQLITALVGNPDFIAAIMDSEAFNLALEDKIRYILANP